MARLLCLLLLHGGSVASFMLPARASLRGAQPVRLSKMQADPFDVPRPDPAILISAKPPDEQKLWIAGISGGLLVSTALLVTLLSAVESALPTGWFGTLGNLGSVPLGLVFAALGAAHFAKKETFLGIVPPLGTWGGLWQVPAPGECQCSRHLRHRLNLLPHLTRRPRRQHYLSS